MTSLPAGPVCLVISVMPSIFSAVGKTSSIALTTLTPPPLPRPPAWICAFTTHTGPPSFFASASASGAV